MNRRMKKYEELKELKLDYPELIIKDDKENIEEELGIYLITLFGH